jgi:hypothetical protein
MKNNIVFPKSSAPWGKITHAFIGYRLSLWQKIKIFFGKKDPRWIEFDDNESIK